MKQRIVLGFFAAFALVMLCSHSAGNNGNLSGSAGGGSCNSCHSSTTNIGTTIALDSAGVPVTSYHPGIVYTVKISATNNTGSNLPKFGCEMSVVKLANAGTGSAVFAGTWGTPPTGMTSHGSYIEHTTRLSPTSGTGANGTVYTESISWTAPAAGTGSVKLYGVINAVNNNGSSSGDASQLATPVTITEAVTAVAPVASVTIAITSGSNPTCSATPITFTATPTNGGTTPTYQWKVGTTVVGTGPTYTSSTLANGNVVTCVMTSNLSGVTGSPATSNAITMTVNPTVTASVSITSTASSICSGTSVTFTAHPTNGGSPTYQWKVGTTVVGTGLTYTSSTLANGNVVTCVMTPTGTCVTPATATSNAITMTVTPSVTDSVSITTTASTICAGTSVTFTAHPVNGGASPTYQWKVGSTVVGTGTTYTSSTLANGNVVTCIMTPSGSCVSPATSTSNAITMTLSATVAPTIVISGPAAVCPGKADTFTAQVTGGGTTPAFAWRVNGSPAGTNSSTFIIPSVTTASAITCTLTSSSSCASPTTAASNTINVTINPTPTATITPSGIITICAGDSLLLTGGGGTSYLWSNTATGITTTVHQAGTYTLTATDANGCTASSTNATTLALHAPAMPTITQAGNVITSSLGSSYQWLVNDTIIGGADTTQSITITESAGYKVVITDTTGCSAVSGTYFFTYTGPSGITGVGADLGVRLYPVPNHGSFTIDMAAYSDARLMIYDVYGKALYHEPIISSHQEINDVTLSPALYFVQISSGGQVQTIKMLVVKE